MGGANQADPDFSISNNISFILDWKLSVTDEELANSTTMQATKQKVFTIQGEQFVLDCKFHPSN